MGEREALPVTAELEVDLTACALEVMSPTPDQDFIDSDDVDADEPGLQIEVEAEVAGEGCTVFRASGCDTIARASFREIEDARIESEHTLAEASGQVLCVEVEDVAGNRTRQEVSLARTICSSAQTLCDRQCVDDVSDNPLRCGETCMVCSAPANALATCDAGVCGFECEPSYHLEDGACRYRPGCTDLRTACCGDDCCALDAIGADDGQDLQFQRGYDASDMPAGIQGFQARDDDARVALDPFQLDRYEVSVGRFRRFLAAYDAWAGQGGANLLMGDAAHPAIPNSGWQWLPSSMVLDTVMGAMVTIVPESSGDFVERITACDPTTWSDEPGSAAEEALPVTCVSFYEAMLFCMWDEGRLPTEAEWNAAASGGGQQRAYPWSEDPDDLTINATLATYDRAPEQGPETVCAKPLGRGSWGTHGLAGNVFEWVRDGGDPATLDAYVSGTSNPCDLSMDSDFEGKRRILRGGSYKFGANYLRTPFRELRNPITRIHDVGFRCARPADAL